MIIINIIIIIIITSILEPAVTKPVGRNIEGKWYDHSERRVFQGESVVEGPKKTAFPRCKATDSRWNRKPVSLVSWVTADILQPTCCISSTARWFHIPAVLTAIGTNMWLLASCLYLASLVLVALSAAALAVAAVPGSYLRFRPHCMASKSTATTSRRRRQCQFVRAISGSFGHLLRGSQKILSETTLTLVHVHEVHRCTIWTTVITIAITECCL